MAREAFSEQELLDALEQQFYIPVIVDGDVEKETMQHYGVRGFPTLKFMDFKGEVVGEMQGRTAPALAAASKAAVKQGGGLKLSKPFMSLLKQESKLDKAMAKKKFKDALKAIDEILEIRAEGSVATKANKIKADIVAEAQQQLDAAKSSMESDPGRAKRELKSIAKDFKGLDIADEAAELAKSLDQ